MKKLSCILLALIIILGLGTTAFAAETTSVTIDDPSASRTYNGYQLLNLTISLKEEGHHSATCDGTNHTDDCYNYAYTVNKTYRAILQAETLANGGDEFWGTAGKPAAAGDVTDPQILEYLSRQTSDNDDGYGSLRTVADRIYRAIKAAKLVADKTDMTGQNDEIGQGYWLIADVTNLSNKEEANSLVIVDTKGESDITVSPKTAIPTVEKKVKDIEDSKDRTIEGNSWQDSADHDIGDTVPFKLTATLPSNVQYYESYKVVFHDTLSDGLTLNAESIKIYMYKTKDQADKDTELNGFAKDVTVSFGATTADLTDDCTFEVGCEDVFDIEGVTKDTAFVVYYEATLNEGAVIGAAGNPNKVYLEFSNNPYGEGTGKTAEDKVIVFTYQVTVNKTDSHDVPLEGAGFTLSKKNVDGIYTAIGEELKGDEMTTFTWKGLDDGDYKLVETTVPAGYNKMDDILFSISADHDVTDDDPQLTSLGGGEMGTGVVDTGAITRDIVNKTGTILPETGAEGTFMLISGGAMFVIVAAVFMVTRKKMSIYED